MADYGNNFVQLHNHTHYSLLDGASKIPDLAKRAAELGMPAVGITDHGNMHGAYEMYTNCVANGVKPIIGIEAYVTPETARQDKSRVHWGTEAQRRDDVSGGGLITHLTMWAENDEGLVNLIKASSVANLEGRVMRYPRMDKEVLATYSKGVIASSGCPSGIIQTRLRLGQFDEALRAAGEFQDIFGKDNFFIELMDHGLPIETQVTGDLLTIAKKLNAPLLATNDSHYVHAEDAQAQDAMLCINSGSRLDDPDRFKFDGTGYYIKTAEEMRELFKDHPDACDNALHIYHLQELKAGRAIDCPVYDYSNHNRSNEVQHIEPAPVLIVEGILPFVEPELCALFDYKIFVDTDADERILRRILRDVKERGRSLDSVIDQYLTTVKPMHEAFVEPSKRNADIIVPNGGENSTAVEMLAHHIRTLIERANRG